MKIKVSEATNIQLDWLVTQIDGWPVTQALTRCKERGRVTLIGGSVFSPSTHWGQGGPIIEREDISPRSCGDGSWVADWYFGDVRCVGPSPLIAAMRCYVASKLGDEVDIPAELVQSNPI